MKRKKKITGRERDLRDIGKLARKNHFAYDHHRYPKIRYFDRIYRKYLFTDVLSCKKIMYAILVMSSAVSITAVSITEGMRRCAREYNKSLYDLARRNSILCNAITHKINQGDTVYCLHPDQTKL